MKLIFVHSYATTISVDDDDDSLDIMVTDRRTIPFEYSSAEDAARDFETALNLAQTKSLEHFVFNKNVLHTYGFAKSQLHFWKILTLDEWWETENNKWYHDL